jgi:hypothetical protein
MPSKPKEVWIDADFVLITADEARLVLRHVTPSHLSRTPS